MSDPDFDEMENQIRRDVERACRKLMRGLEEEPETIIIEGDDSTKECEQTIAEISSWLFRRRRENGDTNN